MSRTRLIAFAAALPLAGAALAAGAPQVVGITAAILNEVSIASGGAAQLRPAVLRERVALADRVQTGQRSQLQLMLLDRSTFTVGANARLTIDRFVYNPAGGSAFDATVAKGAFRFLSGRRATPGASSISTPVATIGIRGTVVDGVVGTDAMAIAQGERGVGRVASDPETASLIVLRGPGAATQGGLTVGAVAVAAGGATVQLQGPMQAAYVPRPGARPIGPFTLSAAGLERIERLIQVPLAPASQTAQAKPRSNNAARTLLNIGIGAALGALIGGKSENRQEQQSAGTMENMPNEPRPAQTMPMPTPPPTQTMPRETVQTPQPPLETMPGQSVVK